ncbi:hypothetical protein GCM10007895_21340 [Paraferrimonas sedimenticola]|uniref:Regulatory protein RecX n=2 Tax=Paraferrimonas sedimenticola TaxID=375674 RepID=A0AA37RX04_9GAMM|nr:hypothetical protein GCM10007895_21340 [Paraferrimonas sedimenticola]
MTLAEILAEHPPEAQSNEPAKPIKPISAPAKTAKKKTPARRRRAKPCVTSSNAEPSFSESDKTKPYKKAYAATESYKKKPQNKNYSEKKYSEKKAHRAEYDREQGNQDLETTQDPQSESLKKELKQLGQKECHHAALQLLSRREHSLAELSTKLTSRGFEYDKIQVTLAHSIEQGWQSQKRFAELYIRSKANKGYGPQRIVQQLKFDHKLDSTDIDYGMLECDCDWFELAHTRFTKEWRSGRPMDFEQKQKIQQKLMRRGFDWEQIRYALNKKDDD